MLVNQAPITHYLANSILTLICTVVKQNRQSKKTKIRFLSFGNQLNYFGFLFHFLKTKYTELNSIKILQSVVQVISFVR